MNLFKSKPKEIIEEIKIDEKGNVLKTCRVCLKFNKKYWKRQDEDSNICFSCMDKIVMFGVLSGVVPQGRYLKEFMLFENGIWLKENK